MWNEFKDLPGADSVPSADLMRKATALSTTGHECRLTDYFEQCGISAAIPITHVDIKTSKPHPVFGIHDLLSRLSDTGKSELLFAGHTPEDYEEFWSMWRLNQPEHPIYTTHGLKGRLGSCIPVFAYADEGTSQKRRGLMVIEYQPLLARGSARASDINMRGQSTANRFLYSVLSSRVYSGKLKKNLPLLRLVDHFSKDLGSLFTKPVNMKCAGGKPRRVYLICLGLKGDLAALVKLGQLDRNHLRDTPSKSDGPGICHLCLGGQEGHPWHRVSYESMLAMKEHVVEPWHSEPSLIANIPQSPMHKAAFFQIDIFHCAHKGLWGDVAANTIAALLNLYML